MVPFYPHQTLWNSFSNCLKQTHLWSNDRITYKTDHGQTLSLCFTWVLYSSFQWLCWDVSCSFPGFQRCAGLFCSPDPGKHANKVKGGNSERSRECYPHWHQHTAHPDRTALLSPPSSPNHRHRLCVSECACALAEGSFSVTGRIAGIVAEQVSTQVSWVRPAAEHVGKNYLWLQSRSRLLSAIFTHGLMWFILHLHSVICAW